MRILSGIQPSGALHLGNYFGMMRPAIELQEKGDAFYFIADYHSMTSLFDAKRTTQELLDVALDFLACGLDPKQTVFFRQSDVPEVTELTWILGSVTPMGLLERCHSYKDKLAKGISLQLRAVRLSGADGRRHPAFTTRTLCRSARTRSSTWRSPATLRSSSTSSTAKRS